MTEVRQAITAEDLLRLEPGITDGSYQLTAAEARAMLELRPGDTAWDVLLAGARRIRDARIGNGLRFCSIVNAKAGACSENCSYCSQSAHFGNAEVEPTSWLDDSELPQAIDSARANGASALGLVAAWKGLKEGQRLDMVCESIKRMVEHGGVDPDVSLGILESPRVAERLREAGVVTYHHNLETAKSFFDETCTTHDFQERLQTVQYAKAAGLRLCSGGIIGLGETLDQRIEFMEQLRYIEPDSIPVNFLNPMPGTPHGDQPVIAADEALGFLATLRWFLPDGNLLCAGGKEVVFGERLHEVLGSGINALMVGNYLTTLGTSPDYWHEHAPAYGLTLSQDGGCGCGRPNTGNGCNA